MFHCIFTIFFQFLKLNAQNWVHVPGELETAQEHSPSTASYLNGTPSLSICMQTKNGYWENCTVDTNSRPASVSALISSPAFTKEESTVMLPTIARATLKIEAKKKPCYYHI